MRKDHRCILFAFVSKRVVGKDTNTHNWSSIIDNAITQGRIIGLVSPLLICDKGLPTHLVTPFFILILIVYVVVFEYYELTWHRGLWYISLWPGKGVLIYQQLLWCELISWDGDSLAGFSSGSPAGESGPGREMDKGKGNKDTVSLMKQLFLINNNLRGHSWVHFAHRL